MEFMIRPYQAGEERYVADLHQRLYTKEYGWGPSFTEYAMKIALDFAKGKKNDREEMYVAEAQGKLVGCIMLCGTDNPDIGQLRLFAVEKEYRQFGIGSALLQAVFQKIKEAGYKQVILWTASPLTAAIRHYKKLGFQTVEKVPNHSWSTDGSSLDEVKMILNIK